MERKHKNNVAEFRRLIGKTQRQLAIDVGASNTTIQNIEYGDNTPTIYLAKRIAKALKIDIDKVFPDCEETETT